MDDRTFKLDEYSCPKCKSDMNKTTNKNYHIVSCPVCHTTYQWERREVISKKKSKKLILT